MTNEDIVRSISRERSGSPEKANECITKKDIVRMISDEVCLTQQQTKEIVQRTFDAIIDSLEKGRRIELRNFGVFEVKQRAARKARNPRTGRQVEVPEKYVVTFKPGKEMEARVTADHQRRASTPATIPFESQHRTQPPPLG